MCGTFQKCNTLFSCWCDGLPLIFTHTFNMKTVCQTRYGSFRDESINGIAETRNSQNESATGRNCGDAERRCNPRPGEMEPQKPERRNAERHEAKYDLYHGIINAWL